MTDRPDDPPQTMRDTFAVWSLDSVEQEAVLRRSDGQHVAVPLPADADLFERLADSAGTIDATLVATDAGSTSWRIDAIHGIRDGP